MVLQNQRPTLESVNNARKKENEKPCKKWFRVSKPINSRIEATKLSFIYTNIDSLLNKHAEPASIVQLNNPDIICIIEFLPKNYRYPVQSSEMEIVNYKCFTNINKLSCHRGVLIYVRVSKCSRS